MMRYRSLMAVLLAIFMMLTGAAAEDDGNLLVNPGFEKLDSDGLPSAWVYSAYRNQQGYTVFTVSGEAHEGQRCAVVNNIAYNDARFEQTVRVKPETLYRLSGWIRAEEIPDSGHGANLSIAGIYVFSEGVYESGEWRYVEMYGETGEDQTELTVYARVGGYGGESTGKAYFDALRLEEVDAVPGDAVAALWFQYDEPLTEIDPVEWEDDTTEEPFWPWLLTLSAAFVLLMVWVAPYLQEDRRELKESRHAPLLLWLGLAASAVLRCFIALRVDGYQVDVGCFTAWGATMANVGPVKFYESTGFCDYPPAYVYMLGLKGVLAQLLSGVVNASFVYKIFPNICDLAASYLLYRFAREEGMKRNPAAFLGLLVAWNPALICNSAAWCQMDSVLCLGLMLVAWLAIRRKWAWVMPVYVLCILIKPQALMLGFLGLAAIVLEWVKNPSVRKQMLIGVGAAVGVATAVLIPFSLQQEWDWLITLYGKTLASYPYATVNTANFYYLFGGNWDAIANPAGFAAPFCLAAMCAAWCAVLVARLDRKRRACLLEPAIMAAFAAAFAVMALIGVSWTVVGSA
ncbi:MAG: hypothetical protein IKK21_08105, partial [Clostridia bacterium]|nr:hypothetical protein [Clostridia bacterium]